MGAPGACKQQLPRRRPSLPVGPASPFRAASLGPEPSPCCLPPPNCTPLTVLLHVEQLVRQHPRLGRVIQAGPHPGAANKLHNVAAAQLAQQGNLCSSLGGGSEVWQPMQGSEATATRATPRRTVVLRYGQAYQPSPPPASHARGWMSERPDTSLTNSCTWSGSSSSSCSRSGCNHEAACQARAPNSSAVRTPGAEQHLGTILSLAHGPLASNAHLAQATQIQSTSNTRPSTHLAQGLHCYLPPRLLRPAAVLAAAAAAIHAAARVLSWQQASQLHLGKGTLSQRFNELQPGRLDVRIRANQVWMSWNSERRHLAHGQHPQRQVSTHVAALCRAEHCMQAALSVAYPAASGSGWQP